MPRKNYYEGLQPKQSGQSDDQYKQYVSSELKNRLPDADDITINLLADQAISSLSQTPAATSQPVARTITTPTTPPAPATNTFDVNAAMNVREPVSTRKDPLSEARRVGELESWIQAPKGDKLSQLIAASKGKRATSPFVPQSDIDPALRQLQSQQDQLIQKGLSSPEAQNYLRQSADVRSQIQTPQNEITDPLLQAAAQALPEGTELQRQTYANTLRQNIRNDENASAQDIASKISDDDFDKIVRVNKELFDNEGNPLSLRGDITSGRFGGDANAINEEVRDYAKSPQFKTDVVRQAQGKQQNMQQAAREVLDNKATELAGLPSKFQQNMTSVADYLNEKGGVAGKGAYVLGNALQGAARGLLSVAGAGAAAVSSAVNPETGNFLDDFATKNSRNTQASKQIVPDFRSESAGSGVNAAADVANTVGAILGTAAAIPKVGAFDKLRRIGAAKSGEKAVEQGMRALTQRGAGTTANKLLTGISESLSSKGATTIAKHADNVLTNSLIMGGQVFDSQREKYLGMGFNTEEANQKAAEATALTMVALGAHNVIKPEQAGLLERFLSKSGIQSALSKGVKTGGVFTAEMGALHQVQQALDNASLRAAGKDVTPSTFKDWVKETAANAGHDFVTGFALGSIGEIGKAPSRQQASAIAEALNERNSFNNYLSKQSERGFLENGDARKISGFLDKIEPIYSKLLAENQINIEQGTGKPLSHENLTSIAIEQARVNEAKSKLENLNESSEVVMGTHQDANGDIVQMPLYRHADGEYYEQPDPAVQQFATKYQDIISNGEKTIRQIQDGRYVKNRLVGGKEMAELAATESPNKELRPEQQLAIEENGPYETAVTTLDKYANDPEIQEEISRLSAMDEAGIPLPDYGSNAPVLDAEGNILDGKKRIALDLYKGASTADVTKPIDLEEANRIITESTDLHIGKEEPVYDGLDKDQSKILKEIVDVYESNSEKSNDPSSGYMAAAREIVERGYDRQQGISLLRRLNDGVISDKTAEFLYNEALRDLANESNQSSDIPAGDLTKNAESVLKDNPSLASIGSPKEYAEYLKSIFPNSQVSDIVFHRSNTKFDDFDFTKVNKDTGGGFDFSKRDDATQYGDNLHRVRLNIEGFKPFTERTLDTEGTKSSTMNDGEIYTVYHPDQIHILGSAKDIEGFKEFAKREEPVPSNTDLSNISSFETSKGSVYNVLDNGKTQRFKTATNEQMEPQDLTVFVKFKSKGQEQDFLQAASGGGNRKVYVIDQEGNIYDSNEGISGKDVRLAIIDPETGKVIEMAETSTVPKEGFKTYDERRYEEAGQEMREKHIGNEVTKINYNDTPAESKLEIEEDVPAGEKEGISVEDIDNMTSKEKKRLSDRLLDIADRIKANEISGSALSTPIPPHIISDTVRLISNLVRAGEKVSDAIIKAVEYVNQNYKGKVNSKEVEKSLYSLLRQGIRDDQNARESRKEIKNAISEYMSDLRKEGVLAGQMSQGRKMAKEISRITSDNLERERKLNVEIDRLKQKTYDLEKKSKENYLLGKIEQGRKMSQELRTVQEDLNNKLKEQKEYFESKGIGYSKFRESLSKFIDKNKGQNNINLKQLEAIQNKADKVGDDPRRLRDFSEYVDKVFDDINYAKKENMAYDTLKYIKKLTKSKNNIPFNLAESVKLFSKVDPKRVDDIDAYNDVANRIKETISKATVRINDGRGEVTNDTFEISTNDIDKYTEQQLTQIEAKQAKRFAQEYADMVESGIIDPNTMSLDEMKTIMDSIDGSGMSDETLKAAETAEKKAALSKVVQYQQQGLLHHMEDMRLSGQTLEATEKKIVDDLQSIDPSKLNVRQLKELNTAINNFITNGSLAGTGYLSAISELQRDIPELLLDMKHYGIDFADLGKLRTSIAKNIGSVSAVHNILVRDENVASEIKRITGTQGMFDGHARAQVKQGETIKEYEKLIKKIGDKVNDPINVFRRGVAAFATQHYGGTPAEMSEQFQRMKDLVKDSIDKLKKSENKESQIEGQLAEQAYNDLLEGSENIETVLSKLQSLPNGAANLEVLDFWRNKWDTVKEQTQRNAEIYDNAPFESVERYTSTKPKRVAKTFGDQAATASDEIGAPRMNNRITVKPSGTKQARSRSFVLPDGIAHDFNFDAVQAERFYENNLNLETSGSIAKLKELFKMPESKEIYGSEKNSDLIYEKLKASDKAQRGVEGNAFGENPFAKTINELTKHSTRIALSSVTQLPLQYISVAARTMSNVGAPLYIEAVRQGRNLPIFKESSIALRGATKGGLVKDVNHATVQRSKLNNTFRSVLSKIYDKTDKYGELFLKPLEFSDVSAARHSWLSYYMDSLMDQGMTWEEVKNIDWSKETGDKINKIAQAYAEQMVSTTQAANDPSEMGAAYRNNLLMKVVAPFSTFSTNMKFAQSQALKKIIFGDKYEKVKGTREMIGISGEAVIFNTLKRLIQAGVGAAAISALQNMNLMSDEDVKKKEESSQPGMDILQGTIGDLALGGLSTPIENIGKGITNEALQQINDDQNFKFFKVYSNPDADLFDKSAENSGQLGVVAKLGRKFAETGYDAVTGLTDMYTKGGFAPETEEVPMSEDERKAMMTAWAIYGLSLSGLLRESRLTMFADQVKRGADKEMKKKYGGKMPTIYKPGSGGASEVESGTPAD